MFSDPVKILSMSISADEVLENDTFTIQFEVEGNPTPIWVLKNNDSASFMRYEQSGGNITIGPLMANYSDSGDYVLQAYNYANNLTSDITSRNLTVLCMYCLVDLS